MTSVRLYHNEAERLARQVVRVEAGRVTGIEPANGVSDPSSKV